MRTTKLNVASAARVLLATLTPAPVLYKVIDSCSVLAFV